MNEIQLKRQYPHKKYNEKTIPPRRKYIEGKDNTPHALARRNTIIQERNNKLMKKRRKNNQTNYKKNEETIQ